MDPKDSAEGAVNPSNASAGVSAEQKQELQRIVMGVFPDLTKRTLQKTLAESLPSMLKDLIPAAAPASEKKDDDKNEEGRRSLKALETQLNELRQQLKTEKEATEAARMKAVDQEMRAEAREFLSGIVGADNPHLPLVMDSLYDAKKRFVKGENGETLVRFKPEFGADDEMVPLGKDAAKRLVSELKHVVPSKTERMPVVGRGRGAVVPDGKANGPSGLDTILNGIVSSITSAPAADPTQK